jgi:preprotein translocase subunit YajC
VFITPAFAQAQGAPGFGDFAGMILPFVLIMAVFWFLLIRPQQRKMKEHQEMLKKVTRGDTIITSGGLIGKVVKVIDDNELQVEIGEDIRVRIMRSGIADVRAKGEPAKAETK